MNVYWTEAAVADLDAIETHISRHSARYARAMIERIIAHASLLSEHPELGSVLPKYSSESLREVLEGSYRVIYRVLPEQVDIVAVIHAARRLPPELPRKQE